jgi:hypothetical protein
MQHMNRAVTLINTFKNGEKRMSPFARPICCHLILHHKQREQMIPNRSYWRNCLKGKKEIKRPIVQRIESSKPTEAQGHGEKSAKKFRLSARMISKPFRSNWEPSLSQVLSIQIYSK